MPSHTASEKAKNRKKTAKTPAELQARNAEFNAQFPSAQSSFIDPILEAGKRVGVAAQAFSGFLPSAGDVIDKIPGGIPGVNDFLLKQPGIQAAETDRIARAADTVPPPIPGLAAQKARVEAERNLRFGDHSRPGLGANDPAGAIPGLADQIAAQQRPARPTGQPFPSFGPDNIVLEAGAPAGEIPGLADQKARVEAARRPPATAPAVGADSFEAGPEEQLVGNQANAANAVAEATAGTKIDISGADSASIVKRMRRMGIPDDQISDVLNGGDPSVAIKAAQARRDENDARRLNFNRDSVEKGGGFITDEANDASRAVLDGTLLPDDPRFVATVTNDPSVRAAIARQLGVDVTDPIAVNEAILRHGREKMRQRDQGIIDQNSAEAARIAAQQPPLSSQPRSTEDLEALQEKSLERRDAAADRRTARRESITGVAGATGGDVSFFRAQEARDANLETGGSRGRLRDKRFAQGLQRTQVAGEAAKGFAALRAAAAAGQASPQQAAQFRLDLEEFMANGGDPQIAAELLRQFTGGGGQQGGPSTSRFPPGSRVPGGRAGLQGTEGLPIELSTGETFTPSDADHGHISKARDALGDDSQNLIDTIREGAGLIDSNTARGKGRRQAAFNLVGRALQSLGSMENKEHAKKMAAQFAADLQVRFFGLTRSSLENKLQKKIQSIFQRAAQGEEGAIEAAERLLRKMRSA